jgi:hypothetical protein
MDKYIGKVILVNLPNNKRPRYRWIVRKRDDGRYIVRTPKIGVLIRDLNLKRDRDFRDKIFLDILNSYKKVLVNSNYVKKI